MCGIAGIYNLNGCNVDKARIKVMLDSIKHRGPDGFGITLYKNIGLGHRLLKIQDLSDKSKQPYSYGKLIMSYNGEIYNYIELREELKSIGYKFESDGDTEVLIKCFNEWGIEKTLNKIDGCFAIALYDKSIESLYLIRDRVGIKPLHYFINDKQVIFSSEIKAILENKEVERNFDISTVLLSLSCKLWMPPEDTLFKNIKTLEQGTYLKINNEDISTYRYYEYKYSNTMKDEEEILDKFSMEFQKSIKKKLISKVHISSFLSGGIDSSLMSKVANDNMENSIDTYTVFYEDDQNYDLKYALELAEKEKFKQHNTLIRKKDYTLKNIDEIIYHVEEILIDKVYLSVYYNYKAAKKDGAIVVLNGQGADEMWLGYVNSWGIYEYREKKKIVKNLIENYFIPSSVFSGKLNVEPQKFQKKMLEKYLEDNLIRYSDNDLMNDYGILSVRTILHDLLLQEDKLAMAHSIESRVPFVDSQSLVDLSMKIGSQLKLKDGREKYILRKYGEKVLPKSIVERKKLPFQEPRETYNKTVRDICRDNWDKIMKSKILNYLIQDKYISSESNFSDLEIWWILIYWRFENVFKVNVE